MNCKDIETNNNWTKILTDGSNLPKCSIEGNNDKLYHCGKLKLNGEWEQCFDVYCVDLYSRFKNKQITHYQETIQLPKPIF